MRFDDFFFVEDFRVFIVDNFVFDSGFFGDGMMNFVGFGDGFVFFGYYFV